jgi:hypothetical protein
MARLTLGYGCLRVLNSSDAGMRAVSQVLSALKVMAKYNENDNH